MNQQTSTNTVSLLEDFDRRPGTDDSGRDFETKIAALVALRCLSLEDTEDMWMGMNINHVGDFDDIVLWRRINNGQRLVYMLQLKHQENPKNITKSEFKNNGKLSIDKFTKNLKTLSDQIKFHVDEEPKIIQHLRDVDEMVFILYTNRGVDECDVLEETHNKKIDFLDTSELENFSQFTLTNNVFSDSFILFPNQTHVKNAIHLIEQEIRKLLGPGFNPSAKDSTKIAKRFIEFIRTWSKGTEDKKYFTLTKYDVICKLSDILLNRYKATFLEVEFANCQNSDIWNNITADKNITIVDSDTIVNIFLNRCISLQFKRYLKENEENWEDELNENTFKLIHEEDKNLEKNLLKMNGIRREITVLDLYISLWFTQKNYLVLKVDTAQDYENILNVLKLSNYILRVIIINKSGLMLKHTIISTKYFTTLCDLNYLDKSTILVQPISLQNRSNHMLKNLLDESMYKLVTCKHVIHILEGNFNVGNKYEALTNFYIDRTLSKIFLNPIVLDKVKDEVFIVKSSMISHHENAPMSNNFRNNVVAVEKSRNLEDMVRPEKVFHEVIMDDDGNLEWKKSFGTTKNIQRYVTNNKIAWTSFKNDESYFLNDTHVISATPGMGKSTFTDYMVVNAPTNIWIIKIILNKYGDHYKNIQNESEKKLLCFFANHILNNCENFDLAKAIFEKCLSLKRVWVIFDGYDEIVSEYETEVIKIAERFHNAKIPLWITTRPNKKRELEEKFSTIAMTLNPLNKKEQLLFLTNYFTKICKPDNVNEKSWKDFINYFTKQLWEEVKYVLVENGRQFMENPLHIKLITDLYSNICKYSFNTSDIVEKELNVIDLYENLITKKIDIVCEKFGNDWKMLRKYYEKSQTLFALNYLFRDRLKYLKLDEKLNEYYEGEEYKIYCLQREGLLMIDKKSNGEKFHCNINFTHRSFAEYLAAKWFAENIFTPDIKLKRIIKKLFLNGKEELVWDMFNLLLAKDCPVHEAALLGNVEKAERLLKFDGTNFDKLDKSKRTILHIIALKDNVEDKKDDDVKENSDSNVEDKDDEIRNLLKNSLNGNVLNTKDLVSEYTALDYAIYFENYSLANQMCEKFPNLTLTYSPFRKEELLLICIENNYRKLFLVALRFYISRDLLMWHLNAKTKIDLYCILPEKSLEIQNTLKNYISELGVETVSELFHFKLKNNDDSSVVHYYYDLNIACALGSKENVEYLLINGSDVNSSNVEVTSLHHAVRHNRLEITKLLLEKEAIIDKPDENGQTALHYAASRDIVIEMLLNKEKSDLPGINNDTTVNTSLDNQSNPELDNLCSSNCENNSTNFGSIRLLRLSSTDISFANHLDSSSLYSLARNGYLYILPMLLRGEDVNKHGMCGESPLYAALMQGRLDIATLLMLKGVSGDAVNILGQSCLHVAAVKGYTDIITDLLSKGADINKQDMCGNTSLNAALIEGRLDSARILLSKNANVGLYDIHGQSCMHFAAVKGYSNIIKELSEKGADINKQDLYGDTPLNAALMKGRLDSARVLLNYANVDVVNTLGQSYIHIAAIYGYTDIITELLSKGADINKQDMSGNTPLSAAISFGSLDSARILILKDANVNLYNNYVLSPLHIACANGHTDITLNLLSKGANINKQDKDGNTPLNIALKNNNLDSANLLLLNNADINLHNNFGHSPMHCSVKHDYPDIIVELLSKGVDINKKDKDGNTPLNIALKNGNISSAKLLLSKNADVNIDNNFGLTPMHCAVENDYTDIILELLSKGADINKKDKDGNTPLNIALKNNTLDSAKLLLLNNADVKQDNNLGHTPIHCAAENDYLDIILELLSKGADINKPDKEGETALNTALLHTNVDSAQMLLSNGANVNADNNSGCSPLHRAAENGYTDIILKLLVNGANINKQDNDGNTSLSIALQTKNFDSARMLIAEGADVNSCNKSGYSLLHILAENGYTDIILEFLSKEVNINKQTADGDTPLYLAIRNGNLESARTLLSNSADVNLCDNSGYSPLHSAAENGYIDIISELLSKGSDINKQDEDGDTPLSSALQNGHLNIARMLIWNGADSNLTGTSENFRIHYTTERSVDIMTVLLSKGANINKQDEYGDTPLNLALMAGFSTSAKLLLSHEAKINLKNNLGRLPLHFAAEYCSNTILDLLRKNANVNKSDNEGNTPLHRALIKSNLESINVLLLHGANCILENNLGNSAIHYAAQIECAGIISKMLKLNASHVNKQNKQGKAPLHYAVVKVTADTLQLFLMKNVDINIQDKNGETPLHTAIKDINSLSNIVAINNRLSVIRLLLDNDAKVNLEDKKGNTLLYYINIELFKNERRLVEFYKEVKTLLIARGANANEHEAVEVDANVQYECGGHGSKRRRLSKID